MLATELRARGHKFAEKNDCIINLPGTKGKTMILGKENNELDPALRTCLPGEARTGPN